MSQDIVTKVVLTNRRGLRLDYSKFDRLYESAAEGARVIAKDLFRARRKKMPDLSDEALVKKFLKGSFLEDWGRWVDQECKVENGYVMPGNIWWEGPYSKKLLPIFQQLLAEFDGEAEVIVRLKSRHHVKYHLVDHMVTRVGARRNGPATVLPRLTDEAPVVPRYNAVGLGSAATTPVTFSTSPRTMMASFTSPMTFGQNQAFMIPPPPSAEPPPEPVKSEPEPEIPRISRYARLNDLNDGIE